MLVFYFFGDSGDAPLGFAVDFKRLLDGDEGPNTGGMGCYTPVEWLPENAEDEVNKKIIWPLLAALKKRNLDYRGCLYVGIMWGESGPKVVEFNVRLGDPECQVLAVADGRDWLSLIETASKKIIDRGAHAKFMTELRKEHARVGRLVNLEILEEFASKELPQA